MRTPMLAVLMALWSAPTTAQTCTAVTPVRLAQGVAGAASFPRPLTSQQATELKVLLPALRAEPRTAVTGLRAWVARSGFTTRDRCPLVFALIRSVATGSLSSTAAADAVVARIQEVSAALAGLEADLRNLQAQLQAETANLKALMAARPAAPPAPVTPDAAAAYSRAMADWQGKVDALQQKIASLQETIVHKKAEIDAKQKELDALLSPTLPGIVEQAVTGATS